MLHVGNDVLSHWSLHGHRWLQMGHTFLQRTTLMVQPFEAWPFDRLLKVRSVLSKRVSKRFEKQTRTKAVMKKMRLVALVVALPIKTLPPWLACLLKKPTCLPLQHQMLEAWCPRWVSLCLIISSWTSLPPASISALHVVAPHYAGLTMRVCRYTHLLTSAHATFSQLFTTVTQREATEMQGLVAVTELVRMLWLGSCFTTPCLGCRVCVLKLRFEQWAKVTVSMSATSAYIDTLTKAIDVVTAAERAKVEELHKTAMAALRTVGKAAFADIRVRCHYELWGPVC